MKKFAAILAALFVAIVALAGSANATSNDDKPDADNKMVTYCHYDGSNDNGGSGKYTRLTTSVMAFYVAGHIDHKKDIWDAFSYTTKGGDVVSVPAQGDTDLLAFKDCQAPVVDKKIAKPEATFTDLCGTGNDVFSVAPGEGYMVGERQVGDTTQSITVTTAEGYQFADGSHSFTITKPLFTNVDCGLPDTGGAATYNTAMGVGALAVLAVLGGILMLSGRRQES